MCVCVFFTCFFSFLIHYKNRVLYLPQWGWLCKDMYINIICSFFSQTYYSSFFLQKVKCTFLHLNWRIFLFLRSNAKENVQSTGEDMLGKPNRVKTRYIKGVGVKGEKRQHHCTLVEILRIYSCFNLPMYCLFSIALFDSYKSPTLRFFYAICKGKLLKHPSEIYDIDFFPFKELPLHVSNSQEQSPI